MATSYTSDVDALIRQKIYTNQTGDITGDILQEVLLAVNDKKLKVDDLDSSLSTRISDLETGKQDTISDLQTIRTGAAAGANALPSTFFDSGVMSHENLAAWDSVAQGVPTYCSACKWEVNGDYVTVSYEAAYGVIGWQWTRYSLPKAPLDGYEVSGTAVLRLSGSVFTENTWVVWVTRQEIIDNVPVKVFAFRKNDGSNFGSGDHINITFTYKYK